MRGRVARYALKEAAMKTAKKKAFNNPHAEAIPFLEAAMEKSPAAQIIGIAISGARGDSLGRMIRRPRRSVNPPKRRSSLFASQEKKRRTRIAICAAMRATNDVLRIESRLSMMRVA
jgi:hypothetical protein